MNIGLLQQDAMMPACTVKSDMHLNWAVIRLIRISNESSRPQREQKSERGFLDFAGWWSRSHVICSHEQGGSGAGANGQPEHLRRCQHGLQSEPPYLGTPHFALPFTQLCKMLFSANNCTWHAGHAKDLSRCCWNVLMQRALCEQQTACPQISAQIGCP